MKRHHLELWKVQLYARLWLNIHWYILWIRRLVGPKERRRMAEMSLQMMMRKIKIQAVIMEAVRNMDPPSDDMVKAMMAELEAVDHISIRMTK